MIKYIATIFLFILPIYLIKKDYIRVENIIIWLLSLFILSIFSLNIEFLQKISNFIGIVSPVNFLIFATFLIFLFLILNLLKKINDLNNKLEDLVVEQNVKKLSDKYRKKK